jgi:hypothetical protein
MSLGRGTVGTTTATQGDGVPDSNGVVQIKDFAFSPEPHKFRLYVGDTFVFEAMPTIPIGVLETVKTFRNLDASTGNVAEQVISFFDQVLLPDSAVELRKRAMSPSRYPFGLTHLQPVMEWLMEEYGMRPTPPSSPSSTGSVADDTTSSTAGAPAEELTPSDSPSLVS